MSNALGALESFLSICFDIRVHRFRQEHCTDIRRIPNHRVKPRIRAAENLREPVLALPIKNVDPMLFIFFEQISLLPIVKIRPTK